MTTTPKASLDGIRVLLQEIVDCYEPELVAYDNAKAILEQLDLIEEIGAANPIVTRIVGSGGAVVDAKKGLMLVPMTMEEARATTDAVNRALVRSEEDPSRPDSLDKRERGPARWVSERIFRLWTACAEARGGNREKKA